MCIRDRQEIILSPAGHLVFDHIQIITTAINRIKNKLDYQPQILRILGNTFTPVSYTHLDVYKRQAKAVIFFADFWSAQQLMRLRPR